MYKKQEGHGRLVFTALPCFSQLAAVFASQAGWTKRNGTPSSCIQSSFFDHLFFSPKKANTALLRGHGRPVHRVGRTGLGAQREAEVGDGDPCQAPLREREREREIETEMFSEVVNQNGFRTWNLSDGSKGPGPMLYDSYITASINKLNMTESILNVLDGYHTIS